VIALGKVAGEGREAHGRPSGSFVGGESSSWLSSTFAISLNRSMERVWALKGCLCLAARKGQEVCGTRRRGSIAESRRSGIWKRLYVYPMWQS
jgi:hypothetical protein